MNRLSTGYGGVCKCVTFKQRYIITFEYIVNYATWCFDKTAIQLYCLIIHVKIKPRFHTKQKVYPIFHNTKMLVIICVKCSET